MLLSPTINVIDSHELKSGLTTAGALAAIHLDHLFSIRLPQFRQLAKVSNVLNRVIADR
jgi:hypothetical protein